MGEMAEWALNGGCCDVCGEVMDDFEEPGHPRTCEACAPERGKFPKSGLTRMNRTSRGPTPFFAKNAKKSPQ